MSLCLCLCVCLCMCPRSNLFAHLCGGVRIACMCVCLGGGGWGRANVFGYVGTSLRSFEDVCKCLRLFVSVGMYLGVRRLLFGATRAHHQRPTRGLKA